MLSVGVSAAALQAHAEDRATLLAAIHNLENPRNLTRPGPRGELGAYQFRASTWRMHTTMPFEQALNREMSDIVAIRHYEWIKRGLLAARMPASTYNIALAWNGGLSATISGRAPRAAHNYAQRAVNFVSAYPPPAPPVPPAAQPEPKSHVATGPVPVMSFFADAR